MDALLGWMWERALPAEPVTGPDTSAVGTSAAGATATLVEARRTCLDCSRALLPLIESGLSPEGWNNVNAWVPAPRASHHVA